MSEKDKKNLDENPVKEEISENTGETTELVFDPANAVAVSSSETASAVEYVDDWIISDEMNEIAAPAEAEEEEKDPIFRELAEPKLPRLPKENRARLQMQSPTRLYFYWSVRNNPFQTLNKAFKGNTGSYTLVARLLNRTRGTEELHPVDPEGNWWFNVEADADYRAEIGFYAPNRPFIRVIFSNEIRTPRRNPSWRTDYTPSFTVSAYEFAGVLDAAGYRRDAFDVAIAGDDETAANAATNKTYARLTGGADAFEAENGDELRFALLALASGYALEDIRGEISEGLYLKLKSEIERLSAGEVLAALKENFDILTDEIFEEEEAGEAVFGASLVNFPRRIRKRSVPKTLLPKVSAEDRRKSLRFAPVSSGELHISS
jgi:hypothetical protein